MVKHPVYHIPEYVPIPIVLENCNDIVKIAIGTDGSYDNSMPDNEVSFDFRICRQNDRG